MRILGFLATCCVVVAAACSSPSPSEPWKIIAPAPVSATFIGAGDMGRCRTSNPAATAALIQAVQGAVYTTGDNAYEDGTAQEFAECYDPSWGAFKDRTYPTPGNHDYNTPGATGYYGYFGSRAGPAGRGYYSFKLGAWHMLALNSAIEDSAAVAAQEAWVRAELARSRAGCVAAYWHHPTFSSSLGLGGLGTDMRPIWRLLYDHGADLIITGHHHVYERFAPQDPDGKLDTARGIRSFIVGTGGHSMIRKTGSAANSELINDQVFGVLKFELHPTSYDWQFLSTTGSFTDTGSQPCHAKPSLQ